MNAVFTLLTIQALMGAVDNLWHHEIQARLPTRISARRELLLHAAREAIYGIVFIGLGWFEWHGAFAAVLAALLMAEGVLTLADFLEEDRTRTLPPFERVLHTLLTISYGLFLACLAPILIDGWRGSTALTFISYGWMSWLCTLYGVGVLAWSGRNAHAAIHLHGLLRYAPPPAPASATGHGLLVAPAVLVTGATGFIGTALIAELRREGRRVIALSRDARQARAGFGPGIWVVESLDAIPPETRIDAIVNLAGARVLGLPWTTGRRRALLASRIGVTVDVVRLMRRLQQAPRVLVSASAVGFYGAPPEGPFTPLDEASPSRPGEFQSELCAAVEHEARRAEALGVRVVRMRFGVVLGLGAILGSGRQPAPWLHLDDASAVIRFAITADTLAGPVNAVAPDTPTQDRFIRALAASFGRPVWLRIPAAPMRALAGEMSTLLLDGQNAVPKALLAAGYRFRHPDVEDALAELAAPSLSPPVHPGQALR